MKKHDSLSRLACDLLTKSSGNVILWIVKTLFGKRRGIVLDLTDEPRFFAFQTGWGREPREIAELPFTGSPAGSLLAPDWIAVPQESVITRALDLECKDPATLDGLVRCSLVAELPYSDSTKLLSTYSITRHIGSRVSLIYSAIKQDAVAGLERGLPSVRFDQARLVPSFAPVYHLFQARYPLKPGGIYAIVHLSARNAFLLVTSKETLLSVQSLAGLSARRTDPNGAPLGESDLAALATRLTAQLTRGLGDLHKSGQVREIAEVLISDSTGALDGLAELAAKQMPVPVRAWTVPGVPPSQHIARGLLEMARSGDELEHAFIFSDPQREDAPRPPTPMVVLRYALHFVVILLLFLTVQLVLTQRASVTSASLRELAREAAALQPAAAESGRLFDENRTLLARLDRQQSQTGGTLSQFTEKLIALTPRRIQFQELNISNGPIPASSSQVRRIAPQPTELTMPGYRVTITGTAADAIAFADYLALLERSGLLKNPSFKQAESTGDERLSFTIEGSV